VQPATCVAQISAAATSTLAVLAAPSSPGSACWCSARPLFPSWHSRAHLISGFHPAQVAAAPLPAMHAVHPAAVAPLRLLELSAAAPLAAQQLASVHQPDQSPAVPAAAPMPAAAHHVLSVCSVPLLQGGPLAHPTISPQVRPCLGCRRHPFPGPLVLLFGQPAGNVTPLPHLEARGVVSLEIRPKMHPLCTGGSPTAAAQTPAVHPISSMRLSPCQTWRLRITAACQRGCPASVAACHCPKHVTRLRGQRSSVSPP
jgi:hypothetical protein